jgi:hypothetical protein
LKLVPAVARRDGGFLFRFFGSAGLQLWGRPGDSPIARSQTCFARVKHLVPVSRARARPPRGQRFRSGGAGIELWGSFGARRSKPLAEGPGSTPPSLSAFSRARARRPSSAGGGSLPGAGACYGDAADRQCDRANKGLALWVCLLWNFGGYWPLVSFGTIRGSSRPADGKNVRL